MKVNKVLVCVVLMFLVLGGMLAGTAMAAEYHGYPTAALFVDGNAIQSDVPPIILNGRTLVPLRVIAEALNATVSYDQQHNYAVITTGSNLASTPTGIASGNYGGLPEVGVLVNGQVLTGDVPPVILNGRTLVPVRLVAEALGCFVTWNNGVVNVVSSSNSDPLLSAAAQDNAEIPGGVTGESNTYNSLNNADANS